VTSSLTKYSNLTQRIITGLLGSAGIIAAICYSPWTYLLVFFIIVVSALWEFYKLAGLDGLIPQKTFGTFCGVAIFMLSFFIEMFPEEDLIPLSTS
jgi:phosphatidate cytidylyltransferase